MALISLGMSSNLNAQQEGDPFSTTYRTIVCENCGAVSHHEGINTVLPTQCYECHISFMAYTEAGDVKIRQATDSSAEFYHTYVGRVSNLDTTSGGGSYPAGTTESEKPALDQLRKDIGDGAYDALLRWIYGSGNSGGHGAYPWEEVPLQDML